MTFSFFTLLLINVSLFVLAVIGNIGKRFWKQILFVQILIIVIVFGLRDDKVGIDTWAYILHYNSGTGGYFKEPAFKYLGFFLHKIIKESAIYILVISLLTGSFAYFGIKKLSIRKEIIPLIAWVFLSNTMVIFSWVNGVRQGIASMIILNSVMLLSVQRKKSAGLCLILAPMFHFSSLVFIGQQVIYKLGKRIKLFRIINSDHYIIDILCLFLAYLLGLLASKIPYLSDKYANMGSKILLIKIALSVFFYFITKYILYIGDYSSAKRIFDTYFFIICLSIFFLFNTEVSNRFLYYGGIFESLILGFVLSKAKKNKIPYLLMLILGNSFYYILTIATSAYANMFNM